MQDPKTPTLRLGAWTLDRIEELRGAVRTPAAMFPGWDPGILAGRGWLFPQHLASGRYVASVGGWLLRGHGRTVLLDTGVGTGKPRPSHPRYDRFASPFLHRLAELGVSPDDVDTVVLSHAHVDHVGGTTTPDGSGWRLTFPAARHLIGQGELEDAQRKADATSADTDDGLIFADSIAPVLAAGRLDSVLLPTPIAPGLTMEWAPGHTLGHAMVRLASDGVEALFTFDVMHSVLQVLRPDWNTCFCEHPEVAAATRIRVLAEAARRRLLLFPTHFGHAGPFRVAAAGDGFRPEFLAMAAA